MLGDLARMNAYDRAIRRLVDPGDTVLDLGCGTGVLAMLCARRGARVHGVESADVAALARGLVAHNGLAERVVIHQADARRLGPAASVDLVVSDFMGRFVFDDLMAEAVRSSKAWMKPDAVFCPRQVSLVLAPVCDLPVPMVDGFGPDLLGIDLAPCRDVAHHAVYPAQLGADALAGPEVEVATLVPPDLPDTLDTSVTLRLERGGVLRAVAGWFVAQLADEVSLSTAPGIETHWGQLLFPIPPRVAQPGETLRIRVCFDGAAWRWSGVHSDAEFELHSSQWPVTTPPVLRPDPVRPRAEILELNTAASAAFADGDLAGALEGYRRAVGALDAVDDDLASPLFENLGLTLMNLGQPQAAASCFLRAMDGPGSGAPQARLYLPRCLEALGYRHLAAHFAPDPPEDDP